MKLRQLFESTTVHPTVGVCYGRWNPPHKGHRAAWEAAAQFENFYIGTNENTAGPDDPLPYDAKLKAMAAIWPDVTGHVIPETNLFYLAAKVFATHGEGIDLKVATDEAWLVNSLIKYNGIEAAHGYYKFNSITAVATPRLSSATALRAAVRAGDREAFADAAGVPANTPIGIGKKSVPYFDLVSHYLAQYPEKVKKVKKVVAEGRDEDFGNFDGWYDAGVLLSWPDSEIKTGKIKGQKISRAYVGDHLVGEWNHGSSTGYVSTDDIDESEQALQFATKAHAGQTRSGGDPYITHPMRVAASVEQYKQSHNLEAIIDAALLHDTVEDTDTTHEDLEALFGGLVASIVKELTSDPEQIKKVGKAAYLSHKMATMSSYALVIKLADRLDNVKDIATAKTPEWRAKYKSETEQILNYIEKNRVLSGPHQKLIGLIRNKLNEINDATKAIQPAEPVAQDPIQQMAFERVNKIVDNMLNNMSWDLAESIRNVVERSPNKLATLKTELEKRQTAIDNGRLAEDVTNHYSSIYHLDRIMVETGTKKMNKKHNAAMRNVITYPDQNSSSGSPYLNYRMGIALAGAPEHTSHKDNFIGGDPLFVPYTKEEVDKVNFAAKQVGSKGKQVWSSKNSEEIETTNKTSIVAAPKRNQYGV
jgi:hypothetical protein